MIAARLDPAVQGLPEQPRRALEIMDGRVETGGDHAAELTWPGGRRLRLVREDGVPRGGLLHHVRFTREDGTFGAGDQDRAALLAKRLGVTVELAG